MNLFAKQKQIDIDTYGYQREKWGGEINQELVLSYTQYSI